MQAMDHMVFGIILNRKLIKQSHKLVQYLKIK